VLAVLAVGSTAPGLLQGAIDAFSQVFPDYRARVLKHEAAHFLVRVGFVLSFVCFGVVIFVVVGWWWGQWDGVAELAHQTHENQTKTQSNNRLKQKRSATCSACRSQATVWP
jgi:hypothetical protein